MAGCNTRWPNDELKMWLILNWSYRCLALAYKHCTLLMWTYKYLWKNYQNFLSFRTMWKQFQKELLSGGHSVWFNSSITGACFSFPSLDYGQSIRWSLRIRKDVKIKIMSWLNFNGWGKIEFPLSSIRMLSSMFLTYSTIFRMTI